MHAFKFAVAFDSLAEAKNAGLLEKTKGRIKYFEILQLAEKEETVQSSEEDRCRQEIESLRGDEAL